MGLKTSGMVMGRRCTVRLPTTNPAAVPEALRGKARVFARYCVVSADDLVPSHTLDGMPCRGAIRNRRAYHTRTARVYVERMVDGAKSGALRPDHVLDPTEFVVTGPPLVTPDLRVVAGTQRTLYLQGAAVLDSRPYRVYQRALLARAERFGVRDPDGIRRIKRPALVRVLEPPHAGDERLYEALNELSDRSISKPLDLLSWADTVGEHLRCSPRARALVLEHFREAESDGEHGSTRGTLRVFLRTRRAHALLDRLVRDGALEEHERLTLEHPRAAQLSEFGRFVLGRVITAAALGDGLALDDVDVRIQDWLGPSIPILLEEPGDAPWAELKGDVCGALRLLRGFGGEDIYETKRAGRRFQSGLFDHVDGHLEEGERAHKLAHVIIASSSRELRARFLEWGGVGKRAASTTGLFEVLDSGNEGSKLPSDYAARFEVVFGDVWAVPEYDPEATRRRLRELRRLSTRRQLRELERLVPLSRWRDAEPLMRSMYPGREVRGRLDDRAIAAGIVLLKRQGVPWRRLLGFWDELPSVWNCGTFETMRRRFRVWRTDELEAFAELCRALGVSDPPERTRGGWRRRTLARTVESS